MKTTIIALILSLFCLSCTSTKTTVEKNSNLPEGAVRIANEELEYEIIIIDIGFETYLQSIAKPANFYSQQYYETKNQRYVTEWNARARNLNRYNPNIYENVINYEFDIDYGLDVNYKLYNYFKFVEHKYGEKFF
jgi:hypothetical protein